LKLEGGNEEREVVPNKTKEGKKRGKREFLSQNNVIFFVWEGGDGFWEGKKGGTKERKIIKSGGVLLEDRERGGGILKGTRPGMEKNYGLGFSVL